MYQLKLPAPPVHQTGSVKAWNEAVNIATYEPVNPDRNPMFLEARVYQGSSGRVYPLPVIDAVSTTPHERSWQAVHLENEFIRVMILPELGGRIHVGLDKTNGYDFFYRQNVIKPALVGLAGPWVSGGVEFNWPQHHRPATFMPAHWNIEEHADGSRTVWLSDHDPLQRLKGMHGVHLRPGSSVLELKVRLYNRSEQTQTFLWWANVAVHAHELYQSFFPRDVHLVADHARRATSEYPLCRASYYGVNYGQRREHPVPGNEVPTQFVPPGTYPPNDLRWYGNIPVPTSYMAIGSRQDFFGGYDHRKQAGLVCIANHHIAPGKKQWTWGNHAFGYAWDRSLTDTDGPYLELMSGVYTDNQPDFSFLVPGETRTFSQYWYPIQKIGPAVAATTSAAIGISPLAGALRVGIAVTKHDQLMDVHIALKNRTIVRQNVMATPASPWIKEIMIPRQIDSDDLTIRVRDANGAMLVELVPEQNRKDRPPRPAAAPPSPKATATLQDLYLTGVHLEQIRHATRSGADYWREALKREPADYRCHQAMGVWHTARGEFAAATKHFSAAISALTRFNANPSEGDVFYNAAVALRWQGKDEEAADHFYKATWNHAWQSPAFYALAQHEATRGNWEIALDHLERCLRVNVEHLAARTLKAVMLAKLGRIPQMQELLEATHHLDPLDTGCNYLLGRRQFLDTQQQMDLSLEFAQSGLWDDAIDCLRQTSGQISRGTAPLLHYYRGYFHLMAGRHPQARKEFLSASGTSPDYCFPARLADQRILQSAIDLNSKDGLAHYLLGNWLYDRRRHAEAIRHWEMARRKGVAYSVLYRNLAIGYHNVSHRPYKALAAYHIAQRAAPSDARLVYEADQLKRRLCVPVNQRLAYLEAHQEQVEQRHDLTIEFCALLNLAGRYSQALGILETRIFQPWEGGEGKVLEQYILAHMSLGKQYLHDGACPEARRHFTAALYPPNNLGEAAHPLANKSQIYYYLGLSYAHSNYSEYRRWMQLAARRAVDFQDMAVREFSGLTLYRALALQALHRGAQARRLLLQLQAYARQLELSTAEIDYFATSLSSMSLFPVNLKKEQKTAALFLRAQAAFGLGRTATATTLLMNILRRDPAHCPADQLLGMIQSGAGHPTVKAAPATRRRKTRADRNARKTRSITR